MKRLTATLRDGRTVEYLEVPDPPAGGMKKTYFSPDRSCVVQFFHDQAAASDPERMKRLEAVLGRYNPTLDTNTGAYWKQLFCWPTGIVVRPQIGIVAPTYPSNFFFEHGPFKGKEKEGRYFALPRARSLLPERERGTWINYFRACLLITRAVRKLHQAGLAHSDLSTKNVLIDPAHGQSVIIDIDSLVVPDVFNPDVVGTPGYIAPEVLATLHLPYRDRHRQHPSVRTDQHALPVLIYEYLLFRHPLRGPKTFDAPSAEEQERLEMGAKALFIEHPDDTSNRPADLKVTSSALGKLLHDLFQRAFVKGLHKPNERPGAVEWERALVKTWDLLYPCANLACPQKWFVLHDPQQPVCPFCDTRAPGPIPLLKLKREIGGQWAMDGQLVVHANGQLLFHWHVFDDIFPGEQTNRTPLAYFARLQGKWLLINQGLTSLLSPGGNPVPIGQAIELKEGPPIRLAQEPHGRMVEVEMRPPKP
jgi:hypothetical protein